jgi:hypothetical protein
MPLQLLLAEQGVSDWPHHSRLGRPPEHHWPNCSLSSAITPQHYVRGWGQTGLEDVLPMLMYHRLSCHLPATPSQLAGLPQSQQTSARHIRHAALPINGNLQGIPAPLSAMCADNRTLPCIPPRVVELWSGQRDPTLRAAAAAATAARTACLSACSSSSMIPLVLQISAGVLPFCSTQ